jgi:Arc/MetJ-type ribon-helix-helix transcriptional regulator
VPIGWFGPSKSPMAPLMTPLSVQFTPEQQAWLDRLTRGGLLSRSSVIRLIVAEAMEREQLSATALQRQGLHGQR